MSRCYLCDLRRAEALTKEKIPICLECATRHFPIEEKFETLELDVTPSELNEDSVGLTFDDFEGDTIPGFPYKGW